MGGAGESLTKSVKRALKVITLDIAFTDEVLYTSFAKPNALSINVHYPVLRMM